MMQRSKEKKMVGGVLFLAVLFLSLGLVAVQSAMTLITELGKVPRGDESLTTCGPFLEAQRMFKLLK